MVFKKFHTSRNAVLWTYQCSLSLQIFNVKAPIADPPFVLILHKFRVRAPKRKRFYFHIYKPSDQWKVSKANLDEKNTQEKFKQLNWKETKSNKRRGSTISFISIKVCKDKKLNSLIQVQLIIGSYMCGNNAPNSSQSLKSQNVSP